MIPYETDPSLHDHEPPPPLLGDGFSPPAAGEPAVPAEPAPTTDGASDAPRLS